MIIGGLQKTSLLDYPGKVSAIIFTQGCVFRCGYCQNSSLVLPEKFPQPIPEEEVMAFLKSRTGKLDGVVITGGEPTIYKDLPEFIKKIKDMGYLVKLDTCGINPEMLIVLILRGLLDYIAMDIKAPFDKYSKVAGVAVNTDLIKKSIEVIKNSGVDYEFRTTVVRQQLSPADITRNSQSIAGAKRYFLQKFRRTATLDPNFELMDTYSEAEFGEILKSARQYVKECNVR